MVSRSASADQSSPGLAAPSPGVARAKRSRSRRLRGSAQAVAALLLGGMGCAVDGGIGSPDAGDSDAGSMDAALLGTPVVFAPTTHGFGISAVLARGPDTWSKIPSISSVNRSRKKCGCRQISRRYKSRSIMPP